MQHGTTPPLHIAIDARSLTKEAAGIRRYTTEIVENLCRDESVRISLVSNKPIHVSSEVQKKADLIQDRSSSTFHGTYWLVNQCSKIINTIAPDIFWGPCFFTPKNLSIPTVTTVHDLAYLRVPSTLTRHNLWLFKLFFEKNLRTATHIVTCSETVKTEVQETFPFAQQCTAIYNGGPLPAPQGAPASIVPSPYLLAAGSFEPRKNLYALLEAFALLGKMRPELTLVLVGGATWKTNIAQKFSQLIAQKKLILMHNVSDEVLYSLYRNATAFVFPSLYEGFGIPLVEAATLCPVIASDIAVFQELSHSFTNLRLTSFTVAAQEIADNLQALLNTLEPLGFRSSLDAQRMTWQTAARQLHALFLSLARKER